MKKPNFFIVGVFKAGTTSMHNYLAQHPEIFMSFQKELYHFAPDLNFSWRIRKLSRYLSFFEAAGNAKMIGESSPGYMYSKSAATNIKRFSPQAKIIIMLRNPIDVLYSLHGQNLSSAHEDILDFQEALAAQKDRKNGERIPELCDEPKLLSYFEVVDFSTQLERYLKLFYRQNIHIILFDDFSKNTSLTYKKTLEFLEVEPRFEATFKVYNPRKHLTNLVIKSFLLRHPNLKKFIHNTIPDSWVDWSSITLGRFTQRQRPREYGELRSPLSTSREI